MKSTLFGLALLCALPGCCGIWKCKDEEKVSCNKSECKRRKNMNDGDMDREERMEKKVTTRSYNK